ncbi:MAG: hypothetical protein ACXW2C_09250 [Acidimicrobiia bacterium]
MRSPKTVALVCVLVLGAGACGGSDDAAENRRWARSLCTSLDTWQRTTTSNSEALQEYLKTPNLDTTATKARLTAYLQDATESTDRLIRELEKAGAPAIDAKQQAVRTLEQGSHAVKSAIADAAKAVEALPVDNGEAFKLGIEAANARLSEGFASFGDALDRINRLDADGDLVEAERSVAACRPLLS